MACPHGMPSPASCVPCMEDGPITPQVIPADAWAGVGDGDRAAAVLAATSMLARFESDCPNCGCAIAEGEPIVRYEGRGTPWVHPECAS